MPAAAQQNPTTRANVDQAKGVVVAEAQKRIDNISKMPPEARQNPKVQQALAEAQKIVEAHGQKPENQAKQPLGAQPTQAPAGPATSTHSSGGSMPPGSSATTHGTTPPSGTSAVEAAPGAGDNGAPPHSPGQAPSTPSHPPSPAEIAGAHKAIEKLRTQDRPLSPDQQKELDAAQKTVARKTEENILKQKAGIEARGGKLHPTTAKALADAQAVLTRPGPEGNQGSSNIPDNTTSRQPDSIPGQLTGTDPSTAGRTADGMRPGQAPETQKQAPTQAPQFKEAPSSSQPGPGSSSPGSGLPQTPSSGAALPSKQLQDHVRAAISGHSGKFPGLKAPIAESTIPSGHSSGMWLNPDGSIRYHVPTLAKQFAGMDAQTVGKHIGALLDAHVQASPKNVAPAQVPMSAHAGQPAQGIPGQTAPHALSTIKTALDAHTARWHSLAKSLDAVEGEMKVAIKQGDNAKKAPLEQKKAELIKEMANLAEKARQHVMVPDAARGEVVFTHSTPTTEAKARAGAELAKLYTHASLLPTVGVVDFNRSRAGYLHGMLCINGLTSPSHVMHEIAHGIEEQNPRVLAACQDFLKKRAGNEMPQSLATLTGDPNYKHGEQAYKDRFAELGGKHYMGRIYPEGDGTEILTMGIERLHFDPVEFYINDPEYFEFVIHTLQQL